MGHTCDHVFDEAYDRFLRNGYTAAQASSAAQEAYAACLSRSQRIVAPTITTPGGRLSDRGPARRANAVKSERE